MKQSRDAFPIFAIGTGIVRLIEGDTVSIEYGDGRLSRMLHVSDIEVVAGQSVTRGQRIGTVRA